MKHFVVAAPLSSHSFRFKNCINTRWAVKCSIDLSQADINIVSLISQHKTVLRDLIHDSVTEFIY